MSRPYRRPCAASTTVSRVWSPPRRGPCQTPRSTASTDQTSLSPEPPQTSTERPYPAKEGQVVFSTGSLTEALTFAGPVALKLRLASSTADADVSRHSRPSAPTE
ncbi:CocE/NonD family hydrolase C-terminal non-catalytic domain-containing protein [Streptomyces sp. NBC_01352]|uniref:CocE/NonD family hydrolase C-terminal non-catalytic domain-containing protein n=1 Tax=Streptomyces sp. NBC_01352 TaxID=2903834 RepID=UPI003FCE2BC8